MFILISISPSEVNATEFGKVDPRQELKGSPGRWQRRFLGRRILIACLACAGIGWLPGKTGAGGSDTLSLTFAERVAYQFAIEEVYWRHRIWPKDNPRPKPPLEALISREGVEKKVSDYLRASETLADDRQSPISPAQLQQEMDRMARDTRAPAVLRELFAALDNDPFVIAECLARPLLVGRVLSEASMGAHAGTSVSNVRMAGAGSSLASKMYRLPDILMPENGADNSWTATSNLNAPDERASHTAVWTGSEMIIWGGFNLSSGTLNTGVKYNPATDSWVAISTSNAPTARSSHTALWTGSEMIVWAGSIVDTGGRFNPAADSWATTSTANAPQARTRHTAVWTGSEMIVWAGYGCGGNCRLNTGGRYDPATDRWISTSTLNAPVARWNHRAIWTGSEMIIWGGTDQTNYLRTGGRYNPYLDAWNPVADPGTTPGRTSFAAVWTGHEMIVWGGVDEMFNQTNTGGRYDPATDSWMATGAADGAPAPRDSHSAVWTGREMIIWGGTSIATDFNDGGRYDPGTDSWRPMTTLNAPFARANHSAVWTGNEMIVWGGISYDTGFLLNTGGRYCAQPSTPLAQSAVSRKTHGNAGNFEVDLPLSGPAGVECRSGGTTGDYTLVVTFLANVSVQGNPQATVTSGKGAIGRGGAVDGGAVVTSGNVVTIPLTNVGDGQAIEVTLNNVNGSTNVMIPMRVLMGDVNGNGAVNATDVTLTKASSGQASDATNFRADVNANGGINATDVALVKAQSGSVLR